MATRSVRLDAEAEEALLELQEKTGASLSALLKQGLLALREQELRSQRTAWEHYREIMAATSDANIAQPRKRKHTARDSRQAVRQILNEKRRRRPG